MNQIRIDTLIIGSGVAGTAVAKKLLEADNQASILMLEAGPKVKMKDFMLWQEYLVTGRLPYSFCQDKSYPERDKPGENLNIGKTEIPLMESRLFIYGGTTVHWGGWSFRLKPEDFQLKTNTGYGMDWPISYDDLEKYYCQSEHFIGVAGDSNDITCVRSEPYPFEPFPFTLEDSLAKAAMEELKIKYSHMPIARHSVSDDISVSSCKTTGTCKYCPFGARFVAGNTIDNMLKFNDYPNFQVIHDAVVKTILMVSKNTATGVIYYDRKKKEEFIIEAKQIIVAAGAIESTKLLLRSISEEWPNGIGNDNDLVGRNFATHPYFIVEADLPQNPNRLQPEVNFPTLCSRHFDSKEEQAKGKFILLNPHSSPNVNIKKMMQDGLSREMIDQAIVGKNTIELHGIMEEFSSHHNRIYNYDKLNHFDMMETVVDFSENATFRNRVNEIIEIVKGIMIKMGGENPRMKVLSLRADHAACTCRMANSNEEGVVDKDLKVFDVNNLYICSNAVFPSIGAVNPTLTLAALALRLGDHLLKNTN